MGKFPDSVLSLVSVWTVLPRPVSFKFFFFGATAPNGPGPPYSGGFLITFNDAQHSVRLPCTSDQLVAETYTWQHTKFTMDNIHSPRWIQTHNLSRRVATDLGLRPRGHWGRLSFLLARITIQDSCRICSRRARFSFRFVACTSLYPTLWSTVVNICTSCCKTICLLLNVFTSSVRFSVTSDYFTKLQQLGCICVWSRSVLSVFSALLLKLQVILNLTRYRHHYP